jgi:peroxiredoxin
LPRALLCACLCAPLAAACATTQGASEASADFTLKAVDGQTVSLSEHLGKKVIVLDFWATWCVPCQAEMPHLQALHERYRDQGLVVLGISMDGPETVAQVGSWTAGHGITFPMLLDEDTRAVSIYNPHRSAPFTVVIGRDGKIKSARDGFNPGDEKALEKTVVELLGPASEPAAKTP